METKLVNSCLYAYGLLDGGIGLLIGELDGAW